MFKWLNRLLAVRPPNVLSLSRSRPSPAGSATQRVALAEPRKRRASERPRVGCCEELGGHLTSDSVGMKRTELIRHYYFGSAVVKCSGPRENLMFFLNTQITGNAMEPKTLCLTFDDGPGVTTGLGLGPRTDD